MFGESETLAIDVERVSHQYKLCEETSFPVAFTNSVAQIAQRDHDIVHAIPLACGKKTAIDTAINNIRDNYIAPVMPSGHAAVNQPHGWSSTGRTETESVEKTLTSKLSGLS